MKYLAFLGGTLCGLASVLLMAFEKIGLTNPTPLLLKVLFLVCAVVGFIIYYTWSSNADPFE